ncbi:MAG: sugar ABC transporter permease, partial [Proteobacteria bacterium]|nr:sugar ABC transporter permease [Pseudomonadota bacterium]
MTTTATRVKPRRRRAFSRGDRFTLSLFVGVPTFLHLVWVWIPAIATICLSFTYWNGVNISDIKWAGLANYNTGHPGIEDAIPIFGNYSINTYVILGIASWRHIGYIMLLYLAGLKSVDPSLREAAAIDGATEWQTFRKIVFPAMKPVNTIVIVITVIESLRAFDLIYIIYGTSTGWPILGMLV